MKAKKLSAGKSSGTQMTSNKLSFGYPVMLALPAVHGLAEMSKVGHHILRVL
jgi:hypothetical protein